MAKFELTKTLEGIKVNKRSGIPTNEKINLSFGAIIEDPKEDRDSLRVTYLGQLVDVKLAEIAGCYKSIDGATMPASTPSSGGRTAAPADTRYIKWESVPSNVATLRAKVPGGWLVFAGNGMAFLPDPSHDWDGSSL